MFAHLVFAQFDPHESYPGKSIAEQYHQWDSAYLSRDVGRASEVLSRDFKLVTGGGTEIGKTTYLVSFREGSAPASYRTEMLRISSRNREARVWTREISEGDIHFYIDRWVKERGKWRLLGSKTLREEPAE